MNRKKEILIHIIFWVFYIAQEIVTYPHEYIEKYGYFDIGIKQFSLILVYMFLFYSNYAYLIDKYLTKKKYYKFLFSNSILFSLGIGLVFLQAEFLDYYFDSDTFFYHDRLSYLSYYASENIFYQIVGVGVKYAFSMYKNQRVQDEIAYLKKEAELSALKSQINPHFFFNILNSIYSIANKEPEKTREVILKLSEMMRYSLEGSESKINIKEEIKYIHLFIDLQKIRLANPDILSLDINAKCSKNIEKMILIPFIENIFKYADLSSKTNKIIIKILANENTLNFYSKNEISPYKSENCNGIGIHNVKRRLEILYPEKHILKIKESPQFEVKLEIQL